MTSVGAGEVILRGKNSKRFIAMSSTGSLYTTVSTAAKRYYIRKQGDQVTNIDPNALTATEAIFVLTPLIFPSSLARSCYFATFSSSLLLLLLLVVVVVVVVVLHFHGCLGFGMRV